MYISTPMQVTLNLKPKVKRNRILLLAIFNNSLITWSKNETSWNISKINPNLKDLFQESGMLTYRRPNNLKKIKGINNILNENIILKKPPIKSSKFRQPCNTKNNLSGKHPSNRPTHSLVSHLKRLLKFTSNEISERKM